MINQHTSSPAAAPDAVVDVPNRLRVCDCPECEAIFALPMAVWLRRAAEKDSIYCAVCGAIIKLGILESQVAELALVTVQMVAEIRDQKVEIDTLRNALARMPHMPQGPISAAELERRIKYVVNRAPRAMLDETRSNFGKRICRLCEAVMTPRSLRNHLHREHAAEVAALPAEEFDRP